MSDSLASSNYIELAADIVSAYVSNNSVPSADLPGLINEIHGALVKVAGGVVEAPAEAPKPAVPLKKSVTPDYIICLEDGKKFKSLKRHLRTQYNMTPEQYREKWGLPADYPMVAPNYAKARSEPRQGNGPGSAAPEAPLLARLTPSTTRTTGRPQGRLCRFRTRPMVRKRARQGDATPRYAGEQAREALHFLPTIELPVIEFASCPRV